MGYNRNKFLKGGGGGGWGGVLYQREEKLLRGEKKKRGGGISYEKPACRNEVRKEFDLGRSRVRMRRRFVLHS